MVDRAKRRSESYLNEDAKRRRNLQRVQVVGERPEVERRLEELVFGGEDALLERLQPAQYEDRTLLGEDSSDSELENEAKGSLPPRKKAAWVDEEDGVEDQVEMTHRFRKNLKKSVNEKTLTVAKLQQRLKDEFQSAMGGTPSWAERKDKKKKKGQKDSLEESDDDDDDEDLLRKTGSFVSTSAALPKGVLQIKSCTNANRTRPSLCSLTTTQFHPLAQVILTAGKDQAISLFQVDGKTNPKIQSICLENFPVHKARFSMDGEQVIATSSRGKLFYIYDMMAGKVIPVNSVRGLQEQNVNKFQVSPDGSFLMFIGTAGYLHLLTMKTKELVGNMKINGQAIGATFSPDGSMVYANSDDGEVYVWDVKSRRCVNRFTDEGCLRGTCISTSHNGQYVACGSSSGVVNVYSRDSCLNETRPKPIKAIMNLVTSVSSLAFNPTTEILAIASKETKDAVKMIHIPSFTAFSNFPMYRQMRIHFTQDMDFSPRSGFFSIANNLGRALLYRVKHYAEF